LQAAISFSLNEHLRTQVGASNTETEAWQLVCRTTFLAKIRRVLVD
jgi:hypothetical protein